MFRKVVFALVLLLAVETLATTLNRHNLARTARRRTLFAFTSRWIQCSDPSDEATYKLNPFKDHPVGTGAMASWKTDHWEYNSGFKSATTGVALSDLKMTRVDLCKLQPAVCKHDGAGACGETGMTTTSQATTVCCPALAAGATCAAKGVTRAFMPQIDNEPKFKDWMLSQGVDGFTFEAQSNYAVASLKPTQDEIYPDNTFPKLCKNLEAPAVGDLKPVISSDDYIIDGHHRWSCWIYCSGLKSKSGSATCTDATSGNANVNKANKPMATIMTKVIAAAKNAWGTAAGTAPAEGKKAPANSAGVKQPIGDSFYFASFAEVDEKFGQHAHASEELAADAFVNATREKLAEYGFSLKGGDEALMTLWKAHHAPRLWA